MENRAEEFRKRTKVFALNIIRLYQLLEKDSVSQVLGKQLLRSSTSVAANYRAATRARSAKEFYAKLCITVEEADESVFWLEMINEGAIKTPEMLFSLLDEAQQLTSILAKSRSTTGKNLNKSSLTTQSPNN